MSMSYQMPQVPVLLDQCILDDKGNVYCPVDDANAKSQHPTGTQYASDDNLIWSPQQEHYQQPQQQHQIYTMPTTYTPQPAENAPVLALHRSTSDSNLYAAAQQQQQLQQQYGTRPQNIDKNPQQVFTLEPATPQPASQIGHLQQAYSISTSSSQYHNTHPAAMPGPVVTQQRRRETINMKRAIGMAMLMSCLCPPVGLCGLGAALRGRHLRYKNPRKAYRYKMVSYTMSILAVILIVLGIVIIVLLAEKQYI